MKSLHIRLNDDIYNLIKNDSSNIGLSMNEYISRGIELMINSDKARPLKKCSKCDSTFDLSHFHKKKDGKFGVNSICKNCVQEKQRSKEGHIVQMYSSQRKGSRLRKYDMPDYSSKELIDWCLNQEIYHKLHDEWRKSGYKKELAPSCDRLDDFKSYTFDNLQIITWKKNLSNEWERRKEGANTKQSKKVLQFTMWMELIAEFPSIRAAARETNTNYGNLGQCCRGKASHAGGFIWKFKED